MIVIWEKFVKVWTNFRNLIENFKSILRDFKKILMKIWKFKEKMKFFLQSILILSVLTNYVRGDVPLVSIGAATVYVTPEI